MITTIAQIEVSGEVTFTITKIIGSAGKASWSASLTDIVNKQIKAKNLFILDSTPLGQGTFFENKVDYFVQDSTLASSNISFVLNGDKEFTEFEISFDNYNNQFATEIEVDGVIYANDKVNFFVKDLSNSYSHSIKISKWSAPNSPIIITGVFLQSLYDINHKNLVSFSCEIFDRSNIQNPEYGIISNKGKIEILDYDGRLLSFVQNKKIKADSPITASIYNTLTKKSNQVCKMLVREIDYNENTLQLSIQDDLEEWQEKDVKISLREEKSAFEIYNILKNVTPSKYEFEELDEETERVLTSYVIKFPYLLNSNLWAQWNKLCVTCALHIFKNSNDKVVVAHNF